MTHQFTPDDEARRDRALRRLRHAGDLSVNYDAHLPARRRLIAHLLVTCVRDLIAIGCAVEAEAVIGQLQAERAARADSKTRGQ